MYKESVDDMTHNLTALKN